MSTRFETHIDSLANEIGLRFSPRTDYNSRAARIFQQFYPEVDNETIDAVVTLTSLYYSDPVAYDAVLSEADEPDVMELEPEKQQTRMTLRSHVRAARGMLLRSGRYLPY